MFLDSLLRRDFSRARNNCEIRQLRPRISFPLCGRAISSLTNIPSNCALRVSRLKASHPKYLSQLSSAELRKMYTCSPIFYFSFRNKIRWKLLYKRKTTLTPVLIPLGKWKLDKCLENHIKFWGYKLCYIIHRKQFPILAHRRQLFKIWKFLSQLFSIHGDL